MCCLESLNQTYLSEWIAVDCRLTVKDYTALYGLLCSVTNIQVPGVEKKQI